VYHRLLDYAASAPAFRLIIGPGGEPDRRGPGDKKQG
jgi:hypothetical protein